MGIEETVSRGKGVQGCDKGRGERGAQEGTGEVLRAISAVTYPTVRKELFKLKIKS